MQKGIEGNSVPNRFRNYSVGGPVIVWDGNGVLEGLQKYELTKARFKVT
jgi:hypothetical protein